MQFFYFKDKNQNFAFRGMAPHNDENCLPFEYFRLGHAELASQQFQEILKIKCPISIPDDMVRKFVLEQTDSMINEHLSNSTANPMISQLLNDDTLSKDEQFSLLKGVTLKPHDILWLNKEAQDLGYLLNVYHIETYPDKFNEKQKPVCYHSNPDKSITKIGNTEMTEGEMRALLEQRKVVQARIYHKGNHWHCFFFTFKGLSGQERGEFGSKPHWHYWSDKCGMTLDKMKECINNCKMPTSEVHILIDRDD